MDKPVFVLITKPYTLPPPLSDAANLFYYQLIFLLGLFDTMHDFHNNDLLSFYKVYLDNFDVTTDSLDSQLKTIKVLRHNFVKRANVFDINYYTVEDWINTINNEGSLTTRQPLDIFSEYELRAFPIHQSRLDKNLFIHEMFNTLNNVRHIDSYNIHELNSTIIYNFKFVIIYLYQKDELVI